jgi:flagellar L-ring protein precursor FlgH
MKSNQLSTDAWKLENRNSKTETGRSKLETRNSILGLGSSIFEFLVSNFDFRSSTFGFRLLLIMTLCLFAQSAYGSLRKKSQTQKDYLADYIARARAVTPPAPTAGGFWTPQSPYSDLASDYKARNINDLIVIQVVESTTAAEDGAVKTARTFSASSGVSAAMGTLGAKNRLQNLFSPNSTQTLNGQGQTSSDSTLNTSLSGRVVDVLPNGFLVIEAERLIYMNNQHQTVIIHGVVRPGDINSSNAVASTAISNLELELKGKGVISDGVAPPNKLVRLILKLVGF